MLNKTIIDLLILSCCYGLVASSCRSQESRECESICRKDLNGATKCEVRGAIILPSIKSSVKIEAALEKVSLHIIQNDVKYFSYTYHLEKK